MKRLPSQPPKLRLPGEAAGLDAIVRTLISAFDQADIVALGEWHGRVKLDSDLRSSFWAVLGLELMKR